MVVLLRWIRIKRSEVVFQPDVESIVPLFVNQLVLLRIAADYVAIDLIRQQRLGVLAHVVHRRGIVGPLEAAGGVFQHFVGPAAVGQVLETNVILAARQEILRHPQTLIVGADVQPAQGVKLVVLGALVAVDKHIPLLALGLRLAHINRVFVARLVARLIAIAVAHVRHRMFLLRDARHHLFVQGFAQRLLRLQHHIGVGVLRLQVVQHLTVCALIVAQPVVVIHARITVDSDGIRPFFRFRWGHHC